MHKTYLHNPKKIKQALDNLEANSKKDDINIIELHNIFISDLGLKNGEEFPNNKVYIKDLIARARLNDHKFKSASTVSEIGIKTTGCVLGRANPKDFSIFYGSNNLNTAMYEVLQDKNIGEYEITIGRWKLNKEITLANFVNESDPTYKNIKFAQSPVYKSIDDFPNKDKKESLKLLTDFFNEKFKQKGDDNLYRITSLISGICYSLKGIDGVGYGATSNNFEGYNVALKKEVELECKSVERYCIQKLSNDNYTHKLLSKGLVGKDGSITWPA